MTGSKSKKHGAEEMHRLREELRKKDELISRLEHEKARAVAANKPVRLIPRPKGPDGRSSGFVLQEAMQLKEDGDRYWRLYWIVKDHVHEYLSVQKTISKQDKLRLEKTIQLVAKAAPYFARFEGLWPVHSMITGYLTNAGTRRRRDLREEALADACDAEEVQDDEDDEMDGEEDEVSTRPTRHRAKFRTDSDEEDSDNEVVSQERAGRKKTVGSESKRRAVSLSPADPTSESRNKSKRNSVPKSNKRKSSSPPVDEPAPKKSKSAKKPVIVSDSDSTSPSKPPKTQASRKTAFTIHTPLTWSDLPVHCPNIMCEEPLPTISNKRILLLFNKLQDCVAEFGPTGDGVPFLEEQICDAIAQENDMEGLLAKAGLNNWPTEIDFTLLPARIFNFLEHFLNMIQDADFLQASTVWNDWLGNINNHIFEFSDSRSKARFTNALSGRRCGYYGPKGDFVINSSIVRMLSKHDDGYHNQLFETLLNIVDNDSDRFDEYDETSNLVQLKDFISFILTPLTAALLISEDQDIDLEAAIEQRDSSNGFGDAFHPHDDADNVLDHIHRQNIRAMNSNPPRYRKHKEDALAASGPSNVKKELKIPKINKATISVSDFVEPAAKVKKAGAKKKGDTKGSKSIIKKAANIPSKSYGTRSRSKVEVKKD